MKKATKKKARRHRCDDCGKLKDDVAWCEDPYYAEFREDNEPKWMRWLCNDCYCDSQMAI